jgi:hypothetical protein
MEGSSAPAHRQLRLARVLGCLAAASIIVSGCERGAVSSPEPLAAGDIRTFVTPGDGSGLGEGDRPDIRAILPEEADPRLGAVTHPQRVPPPSQPGRPFELSRPLSAPSDLPQEPASRVVNANDSFLRLRYVHTPVPAHCQPRDRRQCTRPVVDGDPNVPHHSPGSLRLSDRTRVQGEGEPDTQEYCCPHGDASFGSAFHGDHPAISSPVTSGEEPGGVGPQRVVNPPGEVEHLLGDDPAVERKPQHAAPP